MDEHKIIKGLKNMEDWAVEAVVELYGDRLTKSAYMVCSDRYLAEEAVQDAFLTLCRKIDSFREDSSLYSWLYRITINHARNKTRNRWEIKVGSATMARRQQLSTLTFALRDHCQFASR